MLPEFLCRGDVIGVASPSHIATPEGYASVFEAIERMGFQVRAADNLYSAEWGYAASAEARAADINQLIHDPAVKMIFFGGGEGADDLLPLIDYEAARSNPKLWLSYSDGTSILNTIHSKTGHRHKQISGLRTAGVITDPRNFQIQISRGRENFQSL